MKRLRDRLPPANSMVVFEAVARHLIEDRLGLLDLDGNILWQADLPESLVALHCGPFGEQIVCGFSSGLVQCLRWSPWPRHRANTPDGSAS